MHVGEAAGIGRAGAWTQQPPPSMGPLSVWPYSVPVCLHHPCALNPPLVRPQANTVPGTLMLTANATLAPVNSITAQPIVVDGVAMLVGPFRHKPAYTQNISLSLGGSQTGGGGLLPCCCPRTALFCTGNRIAGC